MLRLGTDVKRLQDILTSPKLRGQIGEWSLENLLAQALPKGCYTLQHTFKDGRIVDALVQMTNFAVGIDAKFPLPSFERIVACTGDDEKPKLRRQFAPRCGRPTWTRSPPTTSARPRARSTSP